MLSGVLRVSQQAMGDPLQDEFDVYFARAAAFITAPSPFPSSASTYAADRCSFPLSEIVDYGRHDSLPDIEISLLLEDDQDSVQAKSPVRTSSCRYPHRKRPTERRKGSVSPSVCSFTTCASSSFNNSDPPKETSPRGGSAVSSSSPSSKEVPRGSPSGHGSSCLRAPSPRHELRCHSAPHSRSSSWKKIKRPVSFRDLKDVDQMELDDDGNECSSSSMMGRRRSRVSLEEAISAKLQELKLLQADDCYVVRQFTTSSKGGIVNRGDSIKRRASSTSTTSGASRSPLASPGGCRSSIVGSVSAPEMPSVSAAPPSSSGEGYSFPLARGLSDHDELESAEKEPDRKFHVLVLGDEGVGKTSLLQQFMTSEYMAAVQTSFDDECEKTLSVLLDGEETMLEFIESNSLTAIQDSRGQQSIVDIYIFVYSLTARESLKFVVDQLHWLRENQTPDPGHSRPAIIVANKTDLVRTRQVSEEEGREVSRLMDCGYWEVSTVLNHQLDELLVGIVTQLRHSKQPLAQGVASNLEEEEKQRGGSDSDDGCVKERNCVRSATEMIRNLFRKQKNVSKSCEYLL